MHAAAHAIPRDAAPPARRIRWAIAAIELVVGLGAIFGGYGLLNDAEGLGAKQAWLEGSVFPDYTVPGFFLLFVIGGGMLAAAAVTLFAPRYAGLAAGAMAVVLAAWGVIETVTLGWRGTPQLILVATFVVAPALVLAWFASRSVRPRASAE